MKFFSTVKYYSSSLFTVINGFQNWYLLPLVLFNKPFLLKLKNQQQFYIESLMDAWIIKEVILDGCYSRFFTPKKNWLVVDIGSSIADFDVLLSKGVKKVIGFDPAVSRNTLAYKNLTINRCSNVTIYPQKVVDLNSLFKQFRLKKIDLLKIDCEGAEYPILLKTKPEYLKRINRIVGEYHLFNQKMRQDFPAVISRLKTAGFKVSLADNPVHNNLGFIFCQKAQKQIGKRKFTVAVKIKRQKDF